MACVICLDEEVPSTMIPCSTCFNTKFHEECLDKYRRTKNACPTCKQDYPPRIPDDPVGSTEEETEQDSRMTELEGIRHVIYEHTRIVMTDAYRTCLFSQFLIIIVTLAFVSRTDLFGFLTLLLTILFLAWMHVFERVPRAYVFCAICAGITTVCTFLNTLLYNADPIYISYTGLTMMNRGIYGIREFMSRHHRVHPVQNDDA